MFFWNILHSIKKLFFFDVSLFWWVPCCSSSLPGGWYRVAPLSSLLAWMRFNSSDYTVMRKGSYEIHKSLWRALWVLQSPADFQDKFTHLFSYWGPAICQTRGRETAWTPPVQKPIPFWIGAFYISAVPFISKDHWSLASQQIQKHPSLQTDSFPQLSFPFPLYPSSLSVLIYFLILQHGTLPGSKEGFSWHRVNPDSECSILESNQGRLGTLELLLSRRKSRPPLPLPAAPPVLSWDPAEVQLIHQHVFLSWKKWINETGEGFRKPL